MTPWNFRVCLADQRQNLKLFDLERLFGNCGPLADQSDSYTPLLKKMLPQRLIFVLILHSFWKSVQYMFYCTSKYLKTNWLVAYDEGDTGHIPQGVSAIRVARVQRGQPEIIISDQFIQFYTLCSENFFLTVVFGKQWYLENSAIWDKTLQYGKFSISHCKTVQYGSEKQFNLRVF